MSNISPPPDVLKRHPDGVVGPAQFCFRDCLSLATLAAVVASRPELAKFASKVAESPREDRELLE